MSARNIIEFKPRKASETASSPTTQPKPRHGSNRSPLSLDDFTYTTLSYAAELLHYYRNMVQDERKAAHVLNQIQQAVGCGSMLVMLSGELDDDIDEMDVLKVKLDLANWFEEQPI